MKKAKWFGLLTLAMVFFLLALLSGQILFNVLAIFLALFIYKNGRTVMFQTYDSRMKAKVKESQQIKQAMNEVLQSGKLWKKRRN